MPVLFNCPQCQKRLSVGSRKVGCRVTCPCCTSELTVPACGEAAATATVTVASSVNERLSLLETPIADLVIHETPEPRDECLPLIAPVAESRAACQPVIAIASPVVARPGPIPVAGPLTKVSAAAVFESPAASGSPAIPSFQAPVSTPPPLNAPVQREMIMISRSTLYVQAVLFCLVAGIGFAVGYAVGHGSSAPASGNQPQAAVAAEGTTQR
jgi:hypothetical protein